VSGIRRRDFVILLASGAAAAWPPNVSTLTLGRLDRKDVENMVAQVTEGRVLPPK